MARILVIEDESVLREELIERLEFEGFEAVGAPDGEVGLSLINTESVDLILCDINMPKLTGFEVLQALKTSEKATIPFVILTANKDKQVGEKAIQEGATAYVFKPFSFADLLTVIRSAMKT